jgi:hypothetical protein
MFVCLNCLVLNFELLKYFFSTIFNRVTMFWKTPGFPNKGFVIVKV